MTNLEALDVVAKTKETPRPSKLMVIELSFNSNEFGRMLLVKPSMFGKLEVHASEVVWRGSH